MYLVFPTNQAVLFLTPNDQLYAERFVDQEHEDFELEDISVSLPFATSSQ